MLWYCAQIQGFPTIKFFPAGAKDSGDLKDYMSEYDGGRTSGDIVRWAQEKLADTAEPPEVKQVSRLFHSCMFE